MIKYVVPIITAVFSGMLIGCNAERNLKKGDRYYALGEYYEASVQYKLAYSKTPPKEREKRGERAYKLADCYRRINYTAKAIGAYQNAVRYKYTDTLTYFYLAEMQRRNGDYRNAAKNYALHLETHPGEQRAEIGLESCRLAPEWKKNGSLYTVKEDRLFNSRRADYCPMLTGTDFNQLYKCLDVSATYSKCSFSYDEPENPETLNYFDCSFSQIIPQITLIDECHVNIFNKDFHKITINQAYYIKLYRFFIINLLITII